MSVRRSFVAVVAVAVLVFGVLTTPAPAGGGDPDPINNNQPDIALPGPLTTDIATPVPFAPSVSDPDVGLGNMEMEIDISDLDGVGGRSVPAGEYGTFTWGGGAGLTSDVELEGIAAVNADLATFTYTPPAGFAGLARIVFEIDDQGNTGVGGVLSRTRFIDITVAPAGDPDPGVNSQPDITLPAPLTTPADTPVSFAPSVSDPDVGLGDMEMEIDISDLDGVGGLSVPAGDYGTFTWGGGASLTSDVEVQPLAAQNTDLATFTYTPAPGFTGLARIVFEIDDQGNTGSELPPVVLSRTRFIDITVTEPTPDLSVTKTAPTSIDAGETLTYGLTVSNAGPGDAQAVSLSDAVPAGTTFVSMAQTTGPAFTLTTPPVGGTGTVTATIGSFAAGASATFDLVVLVDSGAANGTTITNTATVSTTSADPDLTNNTDTAATDVVNLADVSITKTGPASVDEGDNITYTLTVTNAGPSAALAVTVSDPVPTGTTFVSATQTTGPAFTLTTPPVGGTGTVSATVASLAAGATATFDLVVHAEPGSGEGTITNTATVTSSTGDPDTENNSATSATAVAGADLALTKDAPAAVELGENIAYSITLTNDGPADAANVTLTDALPSGTTFVSATQTSGPAATLTTPPVGGTGTVSAALATFADGATMTFDIVVATGPGLAGATVINTATAASATGDPDVTNNADDAETLVMATDLTVAKSAPATVIAGETLEYTITITNDGPSDAPNAALIDELPAGTTFMALTQDSGPTFTCTTPAEGDAGAIDCTIATLADGESATFLVTVAVASATPEGSTITNTAEVEALVVETDISNNSASATTTVDTSADLVVAKFGPEQVTAGTDATYSLTIENNGPSDAQAVELSDDLPAGTTFVSITQDEGPTFTCTTPAVGAGGVVTCSIATLEAGGGAHFSLVLHVDANLTPGTSITNGAVAASDTVDADPETNTIVSGAALVLAAGAGALPVTGANPAAPVDAAVLLMLVGAVLLLIARTAERPSRRRVA